MRSGVDLAAWAAPRRRRRVLAGLVGTLIGSGRTTQAQTLVRPVPEVDRLSVRIVTDNIVRQFVPSQTVDGFSSERAGGNQTPEAPPRTALAAEWGLAMFAESHRGGDTRRVLIDFGYTAETLLNNLAILNIDPAGFDALVLSHGHYDHFGGLVGFLKANKGRLKAGLPFFTGGEDCFCTRVVANGGQFGALDRQAILDSDLSLMTAAAPAMVADHAFTTGTIALRSFETPLQPTREKVGVADGFGCFPDKMPAAKNTGTFVPDDFAHELGTSYLVRGKGLVVLTSCSHRGVINTVRQAQAVSGVEKVHAVIGGFHLVPPLKDDYFGEIIAAFKEIGPDYLIPGHCSGEAFYDLVRREMPGKVFASTVGSRFSFTA